MSSLLTIPLMCGGLVLMTLCTLLIHHKDPPPPPPPSGPENEKENSKWLMDVKQKLEPLGPSLSSP
jgi:hypothetical protein